MDYDIKKSANEFIGLVNANSPATYDFIYYRTVIDRNGDSVQIEDHRETHTVDSLNAAIVDKQQKVTALTDFISKQPQPVQA